MLWYIVRHGKTFYNQNNIQQGNINSFLSLEGIAQAQMNGYKLKEIETGIKKFRFLSSPLGRAFHTCQIIKEVVGINSLPEREPLIINRSKGVFENLTRNNIKLLFGDEFEELKKNPWNVSIKNYESYKSLFIRLSNFLEKYKNEKYLIIVSHSGINKVLMLLLSMKKEGKDISASYFNALPEKQGNKLVNELNNFEYFNQNYFFSWDGEDFRKY